MDLFYEVSEILRELCVLSGSGCFRPRCQHFPQRRRSDMAMINRNLVLNSVTRSDNVVTARMGIGSNLAMVQALAALSQFWPEHTVPEPANPMPVRDLAMVDGDYRDRVAARAGRSVRPAGCHPGDLADHSARSAAAKWRTAIAVKRQPFAALAFALNLGLSGSDGSSSGR